MKERFCPKCKLKLSSGSAYFCSFCGEKLPTDLTKPANEYIITHEYKSSSAKVSFLRYFSNSLKQTLYIINFKLLVAILILSTAFFTISYLFLQKSGLLPVRNTNEDGPSSEQTIDNTFRLQQQAILLDIDIPFASGSFSGDDAKQYIPYISEAIVEGADLEGFSQTLFAFDDQYKPVYRILKDSVRQNFVLFLVPKEENVEYGLIMFLKPDSKLTQGDFSDIEQLNIRVANQVVLFSSSSGLLEEAVDTKDGIARNIGSDSKFNDMYRLAPRLGRVNIYMLGDKVLSLLEKQENISPEFSKLIRAVSKSGLNQISIL
ncbi:hypothetical protein A3K34_03465 [candidate division WWE3 bacterium RIFOXYC1_FULL_40_10]|uniref:Zinc-ribbon domain-containing protein n=1 Tax=candidate division WWE3 bacterium RIFOXYA2_FULL_46_9 TaxID=1802636 RepID=A0A1F4VYN4_UNCKA|nr:MAG: hypothetical protein A3K58_03465 [candidate division WWE3 bacterium RIFOXYB1_FULL_40_22]OGC61907.1 MAG: hypothetical protein A3K37_03465 [candidate division WWE3 bacterium RIFOXYA1_FULL_40_11]OGC62274.1 MAG: hypothetical protein A2264_03225 [candidate division WWE3 bacterium RIFOXYA2_FULL_46_9]OGC64377.1 MAG: hypothetical protein A2326_00890 [candidate division WWE3 bacterium RIFOXYB2_FULL_41_6]OGC66290.1 MAG: hypothetical protein A3K34_03465 [candidate division WWE3 bacterium RIFOXYC1_